ncbi:hypothetical protein LWI28_008049 [Acer negundo]|uniref:HMA domain-containing protein n=1 Tax=Acer negundo TaxID=4023 RepID=A0AAD5J3E2_ACENE|nr:hypothetical protein LWI28_008049 [Acer negundo]
MAENHPICVLKVNLQGCQINPEKVNEELQKINGVYGINIDRTEGLVIVTGFMDPPLLIETIKKLGIETQLLAYEKNPTHDTKKKMKNGNDSPSKSKIRDQSIDGGVHHHNNATYYSHYMRPHCTSWHHPGYGMQTIFRGPSYAHGMYPLLYHNPRPNTSYVKSTRPPLPYPFDIYGEVKEPEIGNGYHHYFSEENVNACHIM